MSEMPKLDDDQQAAIDAYTHMDSGLVTLSSVPGAGKSTAASNAVASELLQRTADGDPLPHERIVSVSFSKEDASDIIPDVIAWIETLHQRDETPSSISEDDITELIHNVRESPRIGTVDGLLRSVFKEIATELGFDGMPTVGNTALCTNLHRDVIEWVTSQPELQAYVSRLQTAYPTAKYDMDVVELLKRSFTICRRYVIDSDEFTRRLKTAVKANYCGGKPTSFNDLLYSIQTYRGPQVADQVSHKADPETKETLLDEDRRLYDDWMAVIDDLGAVLESYITRYDDLCIDRGVVSHLDCSYWVNQYFTTQSDSLRCKRLLRRYHSHIESIVIDEAQDLSQIQHDALSHLINLETRILLAGDLQQCIYHWRDASPDLFRRAIDDGEYFGRTWSPHTTENANRNYRSRPEIVRLANAVADRTLNHPDRGGLSRVDVSSPSLSADREVGDGPSIHIARFVPRGNPGTSQWADPREDGNEARILANYVAGAVENNRLTDEDGTLPSITVLFDTRNQMDGYAVAFEAVGFSVANASAFLFDSPVVCAVVAVLDWLSAPTNPDKTKALLTASPLAGSMSESSYTNTVIEFGPVVTKLADVGWSVSEAAQLDGLSDERHCILVGLSTLFAEARRLAVEPAAVVVREIIDQLQLEADPLNIDSTTDRHQRTATLDRLISLVEEWEGDDCYTHRQLCALFEPFVETPRLGPVQPIANADAVDVVFKTIHAMKGDQDDIVVLANPAHRLGTSRVDTTRLVASGGDIALAPPVDVLSENPPQIPVIDEQLYAPNVGYQNDPTTPNSAGLRWCAEYWPSKTGSSSTNRLLGPPVRRDGAAASRAESWRKLYVALTRACEHLILPLPEHDTQLSGENHWAYILYDVIGASAINSTGIQSISLPDGTGESKETDVVVNDFPFDARYTSTTGAGLVAPLRPRGAVSPTDVVHKQWLPRFLRPSTLGPQVDDRVNTLIPALRGDSPYSDPETVSSELPLTFETVTTDEVGDIVHQLVVLLIEENTPAESLQSPVAPGVVETVEELLETRSLSETEVDGLREFLHEWVLPDLGHSALWERVEQATVIYTEEPLQSLTRINNVDVEIHGQADLLLEMSDGTWHVEDIKTALTPSSTSHRRRYQLQIDAYGWVLQQQSGPEVSVIPRVTTVGSYSNEYSIGWPLGAWRQQLTKNIADDDS